MVLRLYGDTDAVENTGPETRGIIAPLALAGALGYMMYRAHQTNRQSLVYASGALLLLQAIATLGITPHTTAFNRQPRHSGVGRLQRVVISHSENTSR